MSYPCESAGCDAVFEHPGSEDHCNSIGGKCEHLIRAGWLAVWVAIESEGLRVFSRGGWLCPDCCALHGIRLRTAMRNNAPLR